MTFAVGGQTLVEDPRGGVILLTGVLPGSTYPNSVKILKLKDASSAWVEMKQTLKVGRYGAIAFFVPDDITNCTLN